MKRVLWISNHPCSKEQREDMATRWGDVDLTRVYDPRWGKINPRADTAEISSYLGEFIPRLQDFHRVVVMGELTACLIVLQWCVALEIPCYTPTTERRSVEKVTDTGETIKTSVFQHVQFRRLV